MNMLHKALLSFLVGNAGLTAVAQELRTSYFMESSQYRHQLNPAYLNRQGFLSVPLLGNIQVSTIGNFGAQTFIHDIDPVKKHVHAPGCDE